MFVARSARPRACCGPAVASPSQTASPIPTWTAPLAMTCACTGCIAGALTRGQFAAQLHAAGFTNVTIEETHRVHAAAAAAIIRARVPGW
ncbi:MAG TPA: hypothetical protein VFW09_14705 [Solirubrobacteraceae bacterium]|nr:hypothetical protein [Solirubrobacteraceae bacterium]